LPWRYEVKPGPPASRESEMPERYKQEPAAKNGEPVHAEVQYILVGSIIGAILLLIVVSIVATL